jgi:uncharacterized protein with PIN domain
MDFSIDLAVDTSAFAAILFQEPETDDFLRILSATGRIGIGAANKVELLMVVRSRLFRRLASRFSATLPSPCLIVAFPTKTLPL